MGPLDRDIRATKIGVADLVAEGNRKSGVVGDGIMAECGEGQIAPKLSTFFDGSLKV
jgi:hypothetical protein